MLKLVATLTFAVLAFSACASSGVVPADKGTFLITKRSAQAGFGPPVGTKTDVYQEANAHCAASQQEVETVDLQMVNSSFGRPGSVALHFRCVKP